ncbi:MAG: protoporphyrinogen oxidase [Nitrospinae bacterium RIFCSPLOWO2_01_FULL_39_10]|nr:MAG: protoporphyrinogen oxidase [Nitrospinae bacterium RIFCSPLOWO2_01_FULL_39_10]
MSAKKIVIIGGGISGLATAYSLEERAKREGKSVSITLLEKKNQIGGNILTERVGDFLIEGGPDCFLSEKPWAIQLCERLGMGESLLRTNDEYRKTYILWNGHLHELPEGVILMIPTEIFPLLKSNLITLSGKIRMGMELFIPKKESSDDESLSQFVCRRLGQEALDKIAAPLVAGVHAEDPDTMSVKSRFPRFVQMEEEYGSLIKGMIAKRREMRRAGSKGNKPKYTMFMTLKDGLSEMPATIVQNLKMTKILTNREVADVDKRDIFKISLKNGEVLDADTVVFATPSYETARLLTGINDSISALLSKIPYTSTATVSLAFKKESISNPMNGFGFLVPRQEKRRITGATWVSRKFSDRSPDDSVLIRCFIGGSHNEKLGFLNDKDMIEMVKGELRDIMGITSEPLLTRIYRWEKAMPQYTIGHEERLSALNQKLSEYPGMFLTGSSYRGSGISECIKDGQLTAESVLKYLNL